MSQKPLTTEQMQEVVNALAVHGTALEAANSLNMARGTFANRINGARRCGIEPNIDVEVEKAKRDASDTVVIDSLRRQLREAQSGETLQAWAKSIIMAANEQALDRPPAKWLGEHIRTPSSAGIPTLMLSDLHWGEVVRGSEIGNVNEYNLQIAQERLRSVIDKTCVLLRDHVVGDYPGIVLCLGGDMISGSIHDELLQTNEGTVMQQCLDLFEHLQAAIIKLADEFGRVHLPAVTGNHGRSNRKWQAKQRAHLSYEWMLYQFLARAFADDKRITFQIPEGPDTSWQLLGTQYRLTHGDSFKGGDALVGVLGPITRGTFKRGRMAEAMDDPFDHLIMGHWHTLIWGSSFIVNGSLKGFDEFAMSLSIPPEQAAQALWLTTEKHGRTIQLPVYA